MKDLGSISFKVFLYSYFVSDLGIFNGWVSGIESKTGNDF
jgi:hypothetical protein